MLNIRNFEPRLYQRKIADSCIKENTLVVLPTGLGKTKVAILVAIDIINSTNKKVLFMTPTRPLASQIQNEFITNTNVENVALVTGVLAPNIRKGIYEKNLVIVSTPQTIENDIERNILDLTSFSLLIVDEVHRAVKKYAYTGVAKTFLEKTSTKNQGRVIGLTASPGSEKTIIEDIKKNLNLTRVEIRGEDDVDVKQYVQDKKFDNIKIELPSSFNEAISYLKTSYKKRLDMLEAYGLKKPSQYIRKLDILDFQRYLQRQISQGNKFAYHGISLTAQLLKLGHAIELLETQGVKSAYNFLEGLKKDPSKAALSLLEDANIFRAMNIMKKSEEEHPKLDKLKEIVSEQLVNNPDSRVIVFAKFRATTKLICEILNIKPIKPIELVGQKEGLKQSEQIQRIKDFGEGKYNCLICTNVGEEGLDIKSADLAIFYDQTGTSVRKIQRSGRVGRLMPGRVVNLITKGTRDESMYYASRSNEKKMKTTLSNMKNKEEIDLGDF